MISKPAVQMISKHAIRITLGGYLLLLTGCFSTPPVEEHFYFLLGPGKALAKEKGPRLLVADFRTAAGYDSARIAYRVEKHELRYYAYRQWVSDPARLLGEMTVRHLRASGKFYQVDRSDKIRDPDAILEATVDAIEEVDKGDRWQARLAMTFRLRRGETEKILLRHAFDVTLPCSKKNIDVVAENISKILDQELKKLIPRIYSAI